MKTKQWKFKMLPRTKDKIYIFIIFILLGIIFHHEQNKKIHAYGKLFYEKGLKCQDSCSLEEKLKYFEKALDHKPDYIDAHFQMAIVYGQMNDFDAMRFNFEKAIYIDEDNPYTYVRIAQYYYEQENWEKAFFYFEKAGGQYGRIIDIYYHIGRLYEINEDYNTALLIYRKAIFLESTFGKAFARKAMIYHKMGRAIEFAQQIDELQGVRHFELIDLVTQAIEQDKELMIDDYDKGGQ